MSRLPQSDLPPEQPPIVLLEKRSVSLAGHRTSVALEPEFWAAVERVAAEKGVSVSRLVAQVDRTRGLRNLASALRVTVLKTLEEKCAVDAQSVTRSLPNREKRA